MHNQLKAKEISDLDLNRTVGGIDFSSKGIFVGRTYYIHVETGYVALRSSQSYDPSNEIGPLWTGSEVIVTEFSGGDYAMVTVSRAAKGAWGNDVTGRSGYVNISYLES